MDEAKEVTIPAILLGAGIVIFVAASLAAGQGPAGLGLTLLALLIWLGVGVALAVGACFLAASMLKTSYGNLGPAILKLAACFAFPTAVAMVIPVFGWVVSLALYLALIAWLFELDFWDVIATAVIIWLVRLVTLLVVASAIGAAMT